MTDPTRPNYLKINHEINFINDVIASDTLKVKLINEEQIQVHYNKILDTVYFQGAYGPVSDFDLDSIEFVNWDYVSDNLVLVLTDSSLNLIILKPKANSNFKIIRTKPESKFN